MSLKNFKLIKKIKLNNYIYELVFETDKSFNFNYGQFITFILPGIGGRAYSVLEVNKNKLTLLIKKRTKIEGGRGGSIYICEREIGDILKGVGPAGHFVLKNNNNNKLFLGTGTGFVPLFNQIKGSIKQNLKGNLKLIFGSRYKKDLFYIDKLINLKKQNTNFDFEIYLSKEEITGLKKGYIIDYLTKNNIKNYNDFYICGIPKMIDSAKKILENNLINEKNIFTEKY